MKYPIGVQSFEKIRKEGYVYVDKTALIHKIVISGQYYFLSRPRRFGKSLLLSTLEALFLGRRDLFRGLAIDSLLWEWVEYPVFHLDLNVTDYTEEKSLVDRLDETLTLWEEKYRITPDKVAPELRFENIIRKAFEQTGRQVVILVDEYDKPMLRALHNPELQDRYRNKLQAFYGVLKSLDPYIKFAMLTGVTRFSKTNIFSSLNNLNDISLETPFNELCGITDDELDHYFPKSVEAFAKARKVSFDYVREMLRKCYDGYHFAVPGVGIYNPFSLLRSLYSQKFGNYWAATGTPTFLVELLRQNNFLLSDLESVERSGQTLQSADIYRRDLVPMFFQSGYLTLEKFDLERNVYTLDFPNREVKESFLEFILPYYSPKANNESVINGLVRAVNGGDTDRFMEILRRFFADFPYEQIPDMEVHYQNVVYLIMKLMGFYVRTEYHTCNGRVDMVIDTKDFVYVIEFKLGGSPRTALRQIEEKGYAIPFEGSGKQIIRLGVVFDKTTRALAKWQQDTKK
ncbi:MAG: ATP-binding protein [Clostridium sp.]|nr:ATP-binding protein [Clostridium sp.]